MGNQANQHNFPIEKGLKKLLNLSTRQKKVESGEESI